VFESGKQWMDENLFNGEYYIQKVVPHKDNEIAEGLRIGMGAPDPLAPDYQMGEACLIDQLLGQYMAQVAGLGYLLDAKHVKRTLQSIYRYNYKPNLSKHDCVSLCFALNDEAGVVIATYRPGKRPKFPFPYFAELWNALEYQFAAHLIYEGMVTEALTVIESVRRRHDGRRRNPWCEPACGHHYARGMSSWAMLVALGGFHYSGVERQLTLSPKVRRPSFRSFWSAPSGWGTFSQSLSSSHQEVTVETAEGRLAVSRLVLEAGGKAGSRKVSGRLGTKTLTATLRDEAGRRVIDLGREVTISPGQALQVTVKG